MLLLPVALPRLTLDMVVSPVLMAPVPFTIAALIVGGQSVSRVDFVKVGMVVSRSVHLKER